MSWIKAVWGWIDYWNDVVKFECDRLWIHARLEMNALFSTN